MNPSNNDAIASLAHQIWEQEGRPEGRALNHWLQAEQMLTQLAAAKNQTVKAPELAAVAKTPRNGRGATQTKSLRRSSR